MFERLAMVQIRGTIRERSVDPLLLVLRRLRERRRVRGVLLDISSGGGGSVPSTDLFRAIRRLDAVKPVYASIGSIGASGAYLAAVAARRLFAYPDSTVGSIGVVAPHLALRKLLDRLGIEVELIHEGRHKDAFQGLRPLTEEERAKSQALAHDAYTEFVGQVAAARRQPVDRILPLATGEVWSGRRALELGLVDALADREEALEELARFTHVPSRRAVLVAPPRPFLERALGGGLSFLPSLSGAVRDALEDSLEELVRSGR